MTTGIIGAGLAGLTAAGELIRAGQRVVVFDKSRGVGGRCATRRAEPHLIFNHGVQYLRATSPEFDAQLKTWAAAGVIAPWLPKLVTVANGHVESVDEPMDRYVIPGGATALAKHLAVGVPLVMERTIDRIEHINGEWVVSDQAGEAGRFGRLILAIPAPQALALLGPADALSGPIGEVSMTPVWALMAAPAERSPVAFDAARVSDSPLAFAMRTPRDADQPEAWSLQCTPDWSARHVELSKEDVAARLTGDVSKLLGVTGFTYFAAHRWRYAMASQPIGRPHLYDPARQLGVIGDWCLGDRVEHAWQSATSLIQSI